MTSNDDIQAFDKIFQELFGTPAPRRYTPDLADLMEWATPAQQKKLARIVAEIIANRP